MRTTLYSFLCTIVLASTAHAHIELLEPIARYPLSVARDNKACPCGVGMSNRLCNVEGDRSDPDRSTDRVTTLVAGSTVTFRFDEYVGHAGRYRVAIDYDGADLDDFNANILLDVPDSPGNTGNVGDLSLWELDVTLPNTPCDNCTLQLIQMMDGNTTDPVPDPVGRSSYYTCADVILVADGGDVDGGVGTDGGVGNGADAGMGNSDAGDNPGDDGGCHVSEPSSSMWFVLGLLGGILALRARRRATEPY